jgi:hypothetical protein
VILLESDFSFPAYLVRNGKKTRISNSREWKLPLAFFSKNSDTEPQKVNLIIEWDEPLPAFIPLGK